LENLTHSVIGIESYMNQGHLMCVSGLSITIHLHNSYCYRCVALTRPCACPLFMSAPEIMLRPHTSGPSSSVCCKSYTTHKGYENH